MLRAMFVKCVLMALVISTSIAISAAESFKRRASCNEGERRCFGKDKASPFYYRCTNGQWTLYTCGSGNTCSGSGPGTKCVSGSTPPPVCQNGQRRCVGSSDKALYYLCSDDAWKLYSCGNGYQCKQTSPLQAACIPTAPPQCTSGTQRCIGKAGSYSSCVDGQWQYKSCKPGDRCINIPGGLINCQVG